MSKSVQEISREARLLSDTEKLQLVDDLLTVLDKPDPEIDRIWAGEARKRWDAYKNGDVPTVSYESVISKYRDR